jgi:Tol biopolymer transport system component
VSLDRVLALSSCLAAFAGCAALGGLAGGDDDETTPPPRVAAEAGAEAGAPETGPAVDAGADGPEAPCDLAKPFGTPTPVAELNTVDEDIVSDVAPDGLTMYMATNYKVTGVHLYYVTRATTGDTWGPRQTLFPLGSFDDWGVAVSPDGLTAIVSSDRNGSHNDLYVATRSSTLAAFGPLSAVAGLNSPSSEEGPHWSADSKTLYFDSTRSGNRELFRASVNGASFGAPQPIPGLGSAELDAVPVPSADELTIYFLSLRAPTPNGDVWFATRATKAAAFSAPQVLPGVNSPDIDAPAHVTADGCTMYLSTIRGGHYDIMVARRPK